MISTAKITSSMFSEIYDELLRGLSPNTSREVWQRAFVRRWSGAGDHFGYALTDGGRIVGMLGMLFSERLMGGRLVPFCNLHGWHVKPEYRPQSLALLKPIQDLKHHTITDFTAGEAVAQIIKRLGFSALDSNVSVLIPVLARGGPRLEIHDLQGADDPAISRLNEADQQICRDHQAIDCGHALAASGPKYCYVVYSRITMGGFPYCLVHHLSDRDFFAEHHGAIRTHLLLRAKAAMVVVEQRQLHGVRLPFSVRATATEKLYRSATVAPAEIDTLYSEMVLHKCSIQIGLQRRVRERIAGWLPAGIREWVHPTKETVT